MIYIGVHVYDMITVMCIFIKDKDIMVFIVIKLYDKNLLQI